jgi:hypothetical protein
MIRRVSCSYLRHRNSTWWCIDSRYRSKLIKELVALVSRWSQGNGISYRRLDSELIDVGTQANNGSGNLQHPNNGHSSSNPAVPDIKSPVEGNNPHSSISVNDLNYIRLHLLKGSTTHTNMLNSISSGQRHFQTNLTVEPDINIRRCLNKSYRDLLL